jgi:CcmD family protein
MTQNARPTTTTGSPEERADEFRADAGGTESASAGTLLVVAYLVMWALLLGFLFLGWRRQSKLDARLDDLEKALQASGKSRADH